MLFNSYPFIFLFLPFTFFLYFYLLRQRLATAAKGFLVFASLFFYAWWNTAYLPIILGSLLFNYVVGQSLNDAFHRPKAPRRPRQILAIGIAANVALLSYFKYTDFLIGNVNSLAGTDLPLLHLTLPLAISFFTFQQIAYLVDSYRGETHEYDFLNYALFVTFFPQLIAGPIVHHKEMMPQFASKWNLVRNYHNIAAGLFVFSIGLFKKVVIADTFAVWATNGFDVAQTLNLVEAWVTSLSFTFQLYFDFSGYTDMAIGAALLFNIRLPFNFDSPYRARSIQAFWRRWHITLSRFLRDYIYIPLGGNRLGRGRTYLNLMATFLLGGIWHGAGWGFVLWGALHGAALVVHRVWMRLGVRLPTLLAWLLTFNFINISWVFFRAQTFDDAWKVLSNMFGGELVLNYRWQEAYSGLDMPFGPWLQHIYADEQVFIWLAAALLIVTFLPNSNRWRSRFRPGILLLIWGISIMLYALLDMHKVSEFLYFNF